jgi:excisionase family DNA binding protein
MKVTQAGPLMSVGEVASWLNVKPSWVYGKVAAREIPHVHVGRYPRFLRDEVEAWLRGEHDGSSAA